MNMNVLVLYDMYSTHINTVYEHVQSLGRFSTHCHVYCDCGAVGFGIQWTAFDAIVIHYSARLITGVVSEGMMKHIRRFKGRKILFVQDEYDLTERLRELIESLEIDLVFTCVPSASIEAVYPSLRFPRTTFVNTLTGFVPLDPMTPDQWIDIADRPVLVGYRGRTLPFWYGDLGQEKQQIAERFREECQRRVLPCDIEWDDHHRIYGEAWPRFLGSCRATLGTESGSNLFDDDGSLRQRFLTWMSRHPGGSYHEARAAVLAGLHEQPLMNQISPRIFEAIAAGTALVLYEGKYSRVIRPGEHFIPLRKDFSNIDDVLAVLTDPVALREMTCRAYRDVIESDEYRYQTFVARYDQQLAMLKPDCKPASAHLRLSPRITATPLYVQNAHLPPRLAVLWSGLPLWLRKALYPVARTAIMVGRRMSGK